MESIYFTSLPETCKDILCFAVQTWVMENAKLAVRSMCCLVFLLGSMPYDVGSNGNFPGYRNLFVKLNDDSKKRDAENTDDDRNDEYIAPTKRSRIENTQNDDTSEEEWMTEDDDNASRRQGSAGRGGDGGDDDDDSDENDEYSEDSGDEGEEDGEEEEDQSTDASTSSEEDVDRDSLLAHAREAYASDSFRIFEHEYKKCVPLSVDVTKEGEVFEYEVGRTGDYHRKYKVTAQFFEGIVNCSCKYFSITGVLCSHAITILQCLHIEKIPDRYLLKWQMKNFSSSQVQESSFLKLRKCQQSLDDCTRKSYGHRASSTYAKHNDDEIGPGFDYIVAPLLRHAKDLYVSETYDMFHKEYRMSEYLFAVPVFEDLNERGIIVRYKVEKSGCHFLVHAEPADGTVNCSCKKFARSGILCSHALLVLYLMDIVKIPPQYIVPSLLKDWNAANYEKIHGPRYPEFESFIRWKVRGDRISALLRVASKWNVELDSEFVEGCLGELSPEPSCIRRGGAVSQKSQKVEAKFCDDQCIRSFTYKDSVITKQLLFNWLNLPRRCGRRSS